MQHHRLLTEAIQISPILNCHHFSNANLKGKDGREAPWLRGLSNTSLVGCRDSGKIESQVRYMTPDLCASLQHCQPKLGCFTAYGCTAYSRTADGGYTADMTCCHYFGNHCCCCCCYDTTSVHVQLALLAAASVTATVAAVAVISKRSDHGVACRCYRCCYHKSQLMLLVAAAVMS